MAKAVCFATIRDMKNRSYLTHLVTLLLGILITIFIFQNTRTFVGNEGNYCPTNLELIRPEEDCGNFDYAIEKMANVQSAIRRQVNSYIDTGRAKRISVFVRDLESQRFAIVNETEEFYMASLMKIPIAIAYYRIAEITPDILDQKIPFEASDDQYSSQKIPPSSRLTVGKSYTVRELLKQMLTQSDNSATRLLSKSFITDEYLQRIIATLGLRPKTKDQEEYTGTVRTYGGVLRTLYNASFLSRIYSNEILDYLTESTFHDGATSLLPESITIAHKFGERELTSPKTDRTFLTQLHDCGVVYTQSIPKAYSFCIMTEGESLEALKPVIQNVSKTIFDGITSL